MRPLAIATIVALGATPLAAGQAIADPLVQIQWGGSGGHDLSSIGISPTPMPQTKPPGAAALGREFDTRSRWGAPSRRDREGKPDRPRPPHDADRDFHDTRFKRDRRPFLFLDDDDEEERIVVVPTPPPEPEEPEEAAPAVSAPPPDPRGPRFVPARGSAAETPYVVGEPLPEGVPFVTLGWSQYGLLEPPPGLIYARVGGDVLLIDPATRRVERRVDPAELETSQGNSARAASEPE